MDLPAHALWAFALFKRYPWQLQAVFFGILPDLIFAVPAFYYWFKAGRKSDYSKIFPKIEPYYRAAHSALTPLALFVVTSVVLRTLYWPVLAGYLLHLLLDLPFHEGGWVQDIAPLYPLYNRRVKGKWWWRELIQQNPLIAVANYALAIAVYLIA